jgi:peroxiredoxin
MFHRRRLLLFSLALPAGAALLSACGSAPHVSPLTLEPQAAEKLAPGHFPVAVTLSPEKPAGVTRQPHYRAKPLYGAVTLGAESGITYTVALDEPKKGDWKIYLDANHNGDLTDDDDGAWSGKQSEGKQTLYGPNRYVLDVTWKLPAGQSSEGQYGIVFMRSDNPDALILVRQGARTGTITLDGRPHKMALIENDGDARFNKPVTTADEARKARPVWLLVDLDDDGRFDPEAGEVVDVRGPFRLAEQTYEASIPPDGASLKLTSSRKKALNSGPDEQAESGLPVGSEAPNFKAVTPDGRTVELSQYRGKTVILDLWATWCGPCQMSMPHVEEVFQSVQGQPVEVLALCVFDERKNFDEWLPENKKKYHFQFAFDPAGDDNAKSIAANLYHTNSIPATFVIDPNGKIAASIPGFRPGDSRIEDALRKLGIQPK